MLRLLIATVVLAIVLIVVVFTVVIVVTGTIDLLLYAPYVESIFGGRC